MKKITMLIPLLLFFFICAGLISVSKTEFISNNSNTANQNSTPVSPLKIDVINRETGGDVTKNVELLQNIPQTNLTNRIIDEARNGTPLVTIGNGSDPQVMIVAGIHGNELPHR